MDGSFFSGARGSIVADMSDCVAAFDALGGELGSVRQAVVDIGGQLSALAAFLAEKQAEDDPLAQLLVEARSLSALLEEWSDPTRAPTIGKSLSDGIRHLDLIERETRMLLSVAALTRVVSADGSQSDLEDYVQSLRDMAERIAEGSLATRAGLRSTLQEMQRSLAAIVAARQAIDGIATRVQGGDAGMAELAARMAENAQRQRALAEAFPLAAARNTSGLVGCIQFSDILSQRLDHAQTMLARSADGAGGNWLADLAATQIAAAAGDGGDVLDLAGRALEALRQEGRRALEAFTGQDGRGVAEALLARRRAELARVEEASDSARLASRLVADLCSGLEARLSKGLVSTIALDRATYAINLSALNATLLSARQSQSREPLKVLSGAVRESAAVCAENSRGCRAAIESCATSVRDSRMDRIRGGADAFQLALDRARAGLVAADADVERLAEMRDAAKQALVRLIAATEAGQRALNRVAEAMSSISATGTSLWAGTLRRSDIREESLDEIASLYTMQRERDVHRDWVARLVAE